MAEEMTAESAATTTETTAPDSSEAEANTEPQVPAYAEDPAETNEPAESEAEAGATTEAKAGGDKATIPDDLLVAAEAVGLSREEAKALGTSENLTRAIQIMDRKLAEFGKQPVQQKEEQQPVQQQKQERKPLFDPELFDETMAGVMNPFADQVAVMGEKLEKAMESLGRFEAHFEQESQKKMYETFDSEIGKLGADYESIFGKGSTSDLAPHSAMHDARHKILSFMDSWAGGAIAKGMKVPTLPELFQKALRAEFGEHIEKLKTKKLAESTQKNARRTVARPTFRKEGNGKTGAESALAAVKAKMAELDID